jgi:hypothetical protein
MNINIAIKSPISYTIEKYIIKLLNKKPPKSYGAMPLADINFIQKYVRRKFNIEIDPRIITSINAAYMKNRIISKHHRLSKYSVDLIKGYPTTNILDLCAKYDIPPMSIMRFILETKYKTKIKIIKKNLEMLSTYDLEQLALAIKSDIYDQLDQKAISIEATNFENKIEVLLKKHNIKFRTQEQLAREQIKLYGKAINTPDFLIDSELIINNVRINWIDAKNFYGSKIKFITTKIRKQIKKYIQEYGSGSIVFSLGFNPELQFDDVLLLSYDAIAS